MTIYGVSVNRGMNSEILKQFSFEAVLYHPDDEFTAAQTGVTTELRCHLHFSLATLLCLNAPFHTVFRSLYCACIVWAA